MYGLAEASAVHLGVEDDEQQGDQGEHQHEKAGDIGRKSTPDTCDQRRAREGLDECQDDGEPFGGECQPSEVEEFEILLDHQPGPDGVHELEHAGNEEH